jgi:hypothetical protein
MKTLKFKGAVAAVAICVAGAASAVPVAFTIDFTETSGASAGSGSFTIDSADLANIPASGTYFSNIMVSDVNFTFGAITFDTHTVGQFAASNGQISGVTGLCCSDFTSSTTPGAALRTETASGAPITWSVELNGNQILSGDTYSISRAAAPSAVPLPAALPLLAFGLGGLSMVARRKSRKAA